MPTLIKKTYTLLLMYFVLLSFCYAQDGMYGIKSAGKDLRKKCSRCLVALAKKPVEVQFAVFITKQHEVILLITDPAWFNQFFKNKKDGIAVDLIQKDQYACGEKNKINSHALYQGTLIPPLYTKQLKQNSFMTETGAMVIKLGEVPLELRNKDLEANYILLNNGYACHYKKRHTIEAYAWDLLDMGMYMDSLVYSPATKQTEATLSRENIHEKKLKFTIPYQKNKYDYSKEDIKPIYDSLNLTDYNIKSINIRGFSSVEGSEENNIRLQEKRAHNIVAALQSYQKATIKNHVDASENWVEFYNDIASTKYAFLSTLNKDAIKESLKDKKLSEELEPLLKNHRKAVLIIELEKKSIHDSLTPEVLVEMFDHAVQEKNISQAQAIQNAVFNRIRHKELPVSFTSRLQIPRQIVYGQLLVNNAAFNYFIDPDHIAAYLEMQKLEELMPENGKVKYNLAVLMFRLIQYGEHMIKPEDLRNAISNLSKYQIPAPLITRMNVNYNIVMTELYMLKGDYANKDKCLRYVQNNFKNTPMTDLDRVSLAQYLSMYSKYEWATKVLESEINKLDAEEALLFYYLNLTIGDSRIINREKYKVVLQNAINANRPRFCKMFMANDKGGVSFQLLDNEQLKKIYCEECASLE